MVARDAVRTEDCRDGRVRGPRQAHVARPVAMWRLASLSRGRARVRVGSGGRGSTTHTRTWRCKSTACGHPSYMLPLPAPLTLFSPPPMVSRPPRHDRRHRPVLPNRYHRPPVPGLLNTAPLRGERSVLRGSERESGPRGPLGGRAVAR